MLVGGILERNWLRIGPSLNELVAKIKDGRIGPRKEVAVVIPTFNREQMLRKHLMKLSNQSFKDFDIVIVYSKMDTFVDDIPNPGIVHIRRKEDIGSAGGFYLGEKFCLQEKYEKIILADDDCLPVSKDLLAKLVSEMDYADLVFPKITSGVDAKAKYNRILAQYGGIRVEALKKTGLTFLPIYMNGEDIELYHRIADNGFRIRYADAIAFHPPLYSLLTYPPSKVYATHRGTILWRALRGKWGRMIFGGFFFLLGGISLLLANRKLGQAVIKAMIMASTLNFSQENSVAISMGDRKPVIENDAIFVQPRSSSDFEEDLLRGEWIGKISERAGDAIANIARIPDCFGKQVIFEKRLGIGEIILMMVAKSSVWSAEGEFKTLAENRFFYLSPLFAALIAISIPAIIVFSFALFSFCYLKKTFLKIDTDRYGVQE